MESNTVITRFPPSPTGFLHLGGARTALFNWLYARRTGGRFILRIEDTDFQRSSRASADAIIEALGWLGIDYDEGPYFQSERLELYQSNADRLFETGHAYICDCTPERLKAVREQSMSVGGGRSYDGACRDKGLTPSATTVVRFRTPRTGVTLLEDRVKGSISFQNAEIEDFIIQRGDKTPMYNFAVVTDDVAMKVNTIIRGDDHVSNTPRQILLYKALGANIPVFAHVPMVLGHDRSRLSKRHGAMSVTAYRDTGFLPEAMINFLVRLGWSRGDQEFFTRDELINTFTIDHIGRSAGVFNPEKLLAINAEHIRAASPARLRDTARPFFLKNNIDPSDSVLMDQVIETLKPRSRTMEEMAENALFYFQDHVEYEDAAFRKFLNPEAISVLTLLVEALPGADPFNAKTLEQVFRELMDKTGLKLGKIAQPVRVALTGKTASPGIFEIIAILGREKTTARIQEAIHRIEEAVQNV